MKVRSFSCDLCPKHFVILRDLRRHHVDEHNFEEEVENLVFDSNTGRLAEGVPAKTVVHNIRAGTSGSSPRMQLVTTKDLRNIADKFRIGKEEQRDPDNFKSVDLWVEEMRAENESPLLYCMKKGDPNSHDGDFELALMTFPQRELLSKLGTEKLCIDSTHGTNKYKFQLTTLLTISEDGSGIPCAYVISKRVSMGTMVRFFEAIKEKTNTVQCQAFMSDDAPVYGNAWEQVMGTLKSRLLCSWHVLHNWGARLNTVTNKDCRDTIRDMLHTLMKCTDETEFQQLLPAFLSIYSKEQQLNRLAPKELEELDGFIRYFEKTYAKRACQWAYCYRQYIGLTTNNHLESMHKTLKYSHFGGKINGRLDKLIKVLFYLTSDKLYNRAIALMKGGADHRKSALFGRHKVGIELCKTSTERVGDGQWHVKSQSLVNFKHTVQRTSKSCSGCELHCKQCEACHNMFTCTCVDHAMHAHMGKHMHAVALMELQSRKLQSSQATCSNCPSKDGIQDYAIDDAGSLMASAQHIMQSTQQGSTLKISPERTNVLKLKAGSTFQMLINQLPEKTAEEQKMIDEDLTKFAAKHSLATAKQPTEKNHGWCLQIRTLKSSRGMEH
ncbi:uncharacterized protein LOC144127880 isoform X2 [Amblyomma americanum]